MTIDKAAELIANRSHSIFDDCGDYDLLKKVLTKAFPKDKEGLSYVFSDYDKKLYGYDSNTDGNWANIGTYLTDLQGIALSDINEDEEEEMEPQSHYDNSKGSLYQFCEDKQLNSYEFDIIKRVMRCRKKGQFKEDLEKTKFLIDLYLTETNH